MSPERSAATAIRVHATATATAITAVTVASQVPPDLWVIEGAPAQAATVAYLIALAWLAVQPARRGAHAIAMSFGVLWWLGRGGGFLHLVTENGRPDLWGAVAERWWAAATVVTVHVLFVLVAEAATPPLSASRGDTTTAEEA